MRTIKVHLNVLDINHASLVEGSIFSNKFCIVSRFQKNIFLVSNAEDQGLIRRVLHILFSNFANILKTITIARLFDK